MGKKQEGKEVAGSTVRGCSQANIGKIGNTEVQRALQEPAKSKALWSKLITELIKQEMQHNRLRRLGARRVDVLIPLCEADLELAGLTLSLTVVQRRRVLALIQTDV
eukprot:404237-Amphidinium_carterae.1